MKSTSSSPSRNNKKNNNNNNNITNHRPHYSFNDSTDISIVTWLAQYNPNKLPPVLGNAFRLGPIQSSLGITQPIVWLANLSCNFTKAYTTVDDPDDRLGPTLGGRRNDETGQRTYPRKFKDCEQKRFDKLQDEYHNKRWRNLLNLGYDPATAAVKVGAIKDAQENIFSPPPLFALSPRMIVTDEDKRMSMRNVLIAYLDKKAYEAERQLLEDLEREESGTGNSGKASAATAGESNNNDTSLNKQQHQNESTSSGSSKKGKKKKNKKKKKTNNAKAVVAARNNQTEILGINSQSDAIQFVEEQAREKAMQQQQQQKCQAQKVADISNPLNKEQLQYLREHQRKQKVQPSTVKTEFTEEDRQIIESALARNGLTSTAAADCTAAEAIYKKKAVDKLELDGGTSASDTVVTTTEGNEIEISPTKKEERGDKVVEDCQAASATTKTAPNATTGKKECEKEVQNYAYAWCCDYCKTATFPTFAEAALHEVHCPVYLKLEKDRLVKAVEEGWLKDNDTSYDQQKRRRQQQQQQQQQQNDKEDRVIENVDEAKVNAEMNGDEKVKTNSVQEKKNEKVENKTSDEVKLPLATPIISEKGQHQLVDSTNAEWDEKDAKHDSPVPFSSSTNIDDDDSSMSSESEESDEAAYQKFAHVEEDSGNVALPTPSPPPPMDPMLIHSSSEEGWVVASNKKKMAPKITKKKHVEKVTIVQETAATQRQRIMKAPVSQDKSVTQTTPSKQSTPKATVEKKGNAHDNQKPFTTQMKEKSTTPSKAKTGKNASKNKQKKAAKNKKQGDSNFHKENGSSCKESKHRVPIEDSSSAVSSTNNEPPRDVPSISVAEGDRIVKSSVIDYEDRVNDTALPQLDHDADISPISHESGLGVKAAVGSCPSRLELLTSQNNLLMQQNKSLLTENETLREKLAASKQQSVEAVQRVQLKAYISDTARASAEERASKLEHLLINAVSDMVVEGVIRQEIEEAILNTVAHSPLLRNALQQNNDRRAVYQSPHFTQQQYPNNDGRMAPQQTTHPIPPPQAMPPWYNSNQLQRPPHHQQSNQLNHNNPMYHQSNNNNINNSMMIHPQNNIDGSINPHHVQNSRLNDFPDPSISPGESVLSRLRRGDHALF